VLEHRFGTVFHTPFIFDVYSATKGYEAFALFIIDDADSIQAMLLGFIQTVFNTNILNINKRLVLLNSPVYNSKDALDKLLCAYKSIYLNKGVYTEVRNHYDCQSVSDVYNKHGYRYHEHLNIIVNLLDDEEKLWNDVSTRRRKEIRHGMKEQFTFTQVEPKDYEDFYNVLSDIYQRAKLPLVDKSFFDALWKRGSQNVRLLGLYDSETLVGAVVLLIHKKTVYGLYGGSKAVYYPRRPNDFLFWQVFLWAKQNGFHTYDWMGAGEPNKPYGVRDWKKQFGGEMVCYGRYQLVHSPLKMKIAETGFRLLQRLKSKK